MTKTLSFFMALTVSNHLVVVLGVSRHQREAVRAPITGPEAALLPQQQLPVTHTTTATQYFA